MSSTSRVESENGIERVECAEYVTEEAKEMSILSKGESKDYHVYQDKCEVLSINIYTGGRFLLELNIHLCKCHHDLACRRTSRNCVRTLGSTKYLDFKSGQFMRRGRYVSYPAVVQCTESPFEVFSNVCSVRGWRKHGNSGDPVNCETSEIL